MKPTVLVFVKYYLPGYRAGGPIRTLSSLVDQLGEEIDFFIVTSDRDIGDAAPFQGIIPDKWVDVGKAKVLYTSPRSRSLLGIRGILNEIKYDVLYLNSLFDGVFTLGPLILRRLRLIPNGRLIIAPRGELSANALALKSLKKSAFLRLARLFGLYEDAIWQASSRFEESDIRKHAQMVSRRLNQIRVVRNVSSLSPITAVNLSPNRRNGPLRVCFLSRISPMKNLDFALEVLTKIKVDVRFSIYGPREDQEYWKRCESIIARMSKNVEVYYHGSVEHEQVGKVLAGYDLFFLPTRGENFGHVILEALSSGLPVLTSDKVPWHDLEEKGAGWSLSLNNKEGFVNVIERVAGWGIEEFKCYSNRARKFADLIARDKKTLNSNRRLFAIDDN